MGFKLLMRIEIVTAHVNRIVDCFDQNVIGFIEKKKSTNEFLDKLRKIKKELKQEKALCVSACGQDVSIRISQFGQFNELEERPF